MMQGKTAFIFGILALALCWSPVIGVLLSIAGIIVGASGLSKNTNRKFVIIGLVLSIIAFIVASFVTYSIIAIFITLSADIRGLTHDIIPDDCGTFGGSIVHSINDTQACLEVCFYNCQKKEMNLTSFEFNMTMPCNTCECYCRR
jgi:hypothetical protein